MKFLLLNLIVFLLVGSVCGQDYQKIKKTIELVKPSPYPYLKSYPSVGVGFPEKLWGNLPIYVWKDMGGLDKMPVKGHECIIFKRFQPTNGAYYLVLLSIGEYLAFRDLLITFDSLGHCVDYLEVGFDWDGIRLMKQFHLTNDMQVIVYHLQLEPGKAITWNDFLEHKNKYPYLKAQRHDYYYQITKEGKFEKVKQIDYQPKNYLHDEFLDNERQRQIYQGNEIPIHS